MQRRGRMRDERIFSDTVTSYFEGREGLLKGWVVMEMKLRGD
jgi:hypothetical protein